MSKWAIPVWPLTFYLVVIFQVTVLPDTMGIALAGRVVNTLSLGFFFLCALDVLRKKWPQRVHFFYIFPIALLAFGYLTNILRSGSVGSLSHMGLVIPWLAALSVPFARGFELDRYWLLFHRFMLVVSLVAIGEYAAVFFGFMTPSAITTRFGDFMKGGVTLFYGLNDDSLHNRMYGVFAEPGTYAMFLLPAMTYALLNRKWIAVAIYFTCLAFTASLGGYIGLVVVLLTFAYWVIRQKGAVAGFAILLGVIVLTATIGGLGYQFLVDLYLGKGTSAEVRESNVTSFFHNLSDLLFLYPLGMDIKGEAMSTLAKADHLYVGSNFSIGSALVMGGFASLIGYSTFIVMNVLAWLNAFVRGKCERSEACVLISFPAILIFLVQRMTIFETVLYSFLFALPLLNFLRGTSSASTALDVLPAKARGVPTFHASGDV